MTFFRIELLSVGRHYTTVNRPIRIVQFVLLLVVAALKVSAQGTAFNYQGRLNDAGSPANGTYDFRFAIYDAVTNGNSDAFPITNSAVAVSSGQFGVTLDFGAGVFTGNNYWLDIGVHTNGGTNFTTLFPRQPIRPVPYAIFANSASNLSGTLPATQITGTLPSAQISGTYSGAVNFVNNTNTFSGTFTGNGAAVTNLNATQLTTGTVADARLSGNVALLNASQTFTGNNNFNGGNNFASRANNFTGSFFGNGLVGWVVITNTAVTALADTGYLLTSSQFTTVTLPSGTNLFVGDIVRVSGAGAGGWRLQPNTNQFCVGTFSSYQNSLWNPASVVGAKWLSLASSSAGNRMYAAGGSGVFNSTDYGHTWNGPFSALAGSWNSVATSADGKTVIAGVPSKAVQLSTDAGATWLTIGSLLASNAIAVACSYGADKAIVANKTGLVYTNNPSGVWVSIGASAATCVAFSGNGNNYAAGNTSGKVVSLLGGSATLTNKAVTAIVISADGTQLAACVNPGGIYTSANGGVSWSVSAAPWTSWNCLAASADGSRLIAGVTNGLLYASANLGATWSALANTTNSAWSSLASSADGSALVAGVNSSAGGIYYFSPATQSTTSTNGFLTGSRGSAVELQYLGNNQFMPVSAVGTLWAN